MSTSDIVNELLSSIGVQPGHALPEDTARLQVHGNKVVGAHLVPGLSVDVEEQDDGIEARIVVEEGARLAKPVQ